MLIFDAHLDLSMNAMEWNRDLSKPISVLRERETGMADKPDRTRGTVSFPEMRRGRVGMCVATQIARYVKDGNRLPGWKSPEQAWAQTQGQLAWYRAMEEAGEMVQVRSRTELDTHLELFNRSTEESQPPIGYLLSLEGADSILSMRHLEKAWDYGLRALGPAHYGPGTYAFGTDSAGPLPTKGQELLKEMDRLGIILDTTHLADECFWAAVEVFKGPLWASHNNCRALVPHNRQFSDEQLKYLIRRGAVIGAALDAWMLIPNWVRGETTPDSSGVGLNHVADHIEHVCQLAGNSLHSGIGSDLDGAFGREQSPRDLDTIADLQKLIEILASRGFSQFDIQNIMSGNFVRFLKHALPQ